MLPREILKKVRRIEIKTSRLVNDVFSGEYHSSFRGRGMEFSEVREYIPGDDIRIIDWNVTARYNHPFVKVYREERELTVVIAVDLSNSGSFGSLKQFRREMAAELAALLAFAAIKNNDKVGLLLFTDKIEKYISPRKGRFHVLRLIRELLYFQPSGKGTNIGAALEYLLRVIKKRSVLFLISDFLDEGYQKQLGLLARKHDVVAAEIYDPLERRLPDVGLVNLIDLESGAEMLVDLSDKGNLRKVALMAETRLVALRNQFRKQKIDTVEISTHEDYVEPLYRLFEQRAKRIRR